MIPLDSPRWNELNHAYGSAGNIPVLLRQLELFQDDDGSRDEPWFSLWSALAHQGDIYPASFAAVPHVVRILTAYPSKADFQYFQFPAWIEICRQKKSIQIPTDLEPDYSDAINRLPSLATAALSKCRDETFVRSVLSAIAVANGHVDLAGAIQELSPDVLSDIRDWLENR